MRETPEQHGLAQRALRRGIGILRQEAEPHRDFSPRDRRDVAAIDAHRARGGRAQSGQRAQQQRFAGAIAAEQRDEFAGADRAVE